MRAMKVYVDYQKFCSASHEVFITYMYYRCIYIHEAVEDGKLMTYMYMYMHHFLTTIRVVEVLGWVHVSTHIPSIFVLVTPTLAE